MLLMCYNWCSVSRAGERKQKMRRMTYRLAAKAALLLENRVLTAETQ